MASRTVSLGGVVGLKCLATQHVDVVGDRFQVIGINALVNSAEMVKLKSLRDCSVSQSVGKPVGSDVVSIDPQDAVLLTDCRSRTSPEPTTIGAIEIDLRPESRLGSMRLRARAIVPMADDESLRTSATPADGDEFLCAPASANKRRLHD